MPRGRKCLLTPELHTKIVDLVKGGNYAHVSAQACGIGNSTFYEWLETGEADKEAGKPSIFADLAEAISLARAEAQTLAVYAVRRAFGTDWKAAMTYLERTDPKQWGRKDQVEATVSGAITYVVDTGVPAPINSVKANGKAHRKRD